MCYLLSAKFHPKSPFLKKNFLWMTKPYLMDDQAIKNIKKNEMVLRCFVFINTTLLQSHLKINLTKTSIDFLQVFFTVSTICLGGILT